MKIAYCGYDYFHTCLRNLLDDGHTILHIYTFPCDGHYNHNDYITEIAKAQGIPVTQDAISEKDIQALKKQGVELLVTAGYEYRIPDLERTGIRGLNIHPTLLPEGRGVWPMPWVILKNHKRTGVTIHKLNQQWDAGDILLQQEFSVADNEVLESLSCKIQILAARMLKRVIDNIEDAWENAEPQEEAISSYWPPPTASERYFDWDMGVEKIDRIVRAFGKFSALASFDNSLWNIYDVTVWAEEHNEKPGSKIHITNTETVIAASDSYVCLRYFQKTEE